MRAALMIAVLLVIAPLCTSLAAQDRVGMVYLDRNANGVRDAGEPGLRGVAVSDQDTVVLTTADGTFDLGRRAAGGEGPGMVFVSPADGYRAVGSFWRRATDSLSFGLAATPMSRSFTFIHASDTHISEQSAPRTRRLRAMVDSIGPAFLIITGDLVRDALRVPEAEARGYYDLFARERSGFRTPVFTVPGNHEIFGIERHRSGVPETHPLFGKTMYRSYFGPDYYSFTLGGVHFVGLNTADVHESSYYGRVDSTQLAWLERDLARLPAGTPVVTFNHIPFYSTAEQIDGYMERGVAPTLITIGGQTTFRHTVSNAAAVLKVLAARRHVLALGGHVHIRELVDYGRDGPRTRFENSAAIVSESATSIGVFPSGFTLYRVRDGVIDAGIFVRMP